MKSNCLYSLVCVLLLGVTACADEEIRPFDEIPEGETTVSATIEFNPLTPALYSKVVLHGFSPNSSRCNKSAIL